MKRPDHGQLPRELEKAIQGDGVPSLLDSSNAQAALIRGIRLHYDFAMSEPVKRLASSMPKVARARNARRIMSDDIPERMAAEEQPYCIWHPDIATEETYRSLASKHPDMKYQVGRACAAAGYHSLWKELDLLPEVTHAEEARESGTDGGKLIYEEIMEFKYRYAIMDDCNRTIELWDYKCPAYLNGDTEVRWKLAARKGIGSWVPDLQPCIEEDKHIGLKDEDVEEQHSILTQDEVELLYSPLPEDLPTVKKTLLIQMAAHDGNVDRYARLMNSGRTLTELDQDCIIRGILHHTMFARWWASQIKNNTLYARASPTWEFQQAILARRIMLNDLQLLEEKDIWERKPSIIWWPLKPDDNYLYELVERHPEMKKEIAAAAIACDYVGIYKKCNPEPSYDLWIVASEISRNPWFREDQERRGREKDVEVEYGGRDDVAYAELAKTMEATIIDEFDEHKTCRDGIQKRTIPRREDWEQIFDTNLVQRKVWDGIGKVSQDDRFVR
ncbi:uncharacterized protein FIESC28_06028 [Fusarium coffeatum]|uniref:Uncharacterized protein n=1 Tax=Fusarium coffeatum TaxID=231269 RepID=A0A366RN53_9HYPO|nr:uncharacterized protein FIESC28_06028 [Fusarium coffeatum]RBR18573.1 hypothetical protein FIESC28_06028 [Fusarium coffeatum]